jgi:hypothetical protein
MPPNKPGRRTRTGKRPSSDLEEIRPHHFLIHNPAVRPIIKSEGEISGNVFNLTSWRRDGMLARLGNAGYVVSTLEDQVAKLPNLSPPAPIGAEALRPLANTIDRYSYFDPLALAWVPLEPRDEGGQKVVALRDGWVVRRRRGRGMASYHRAFVERGGGVGLRPLDELEALLAGYAQASASGGRELLVRREGKEYLLPDVALPRPFEEVLGRFAKQTPAGWRVAERGGPLAQELFAHLGLLLRVVDQGR